MRLQILVFGFAVLACALSPDTMSRALEATMSGLVAIGRRGGDWARRIGGRGVPGLAVVVIPARYGSTRFPAKPLALINGQPLVAHTLLRSRRAKSVHDVVVATDSEEIQHIVQQYKATVVMTSPDIRTGTDRVSEALRMLRKEGAQYDIVVNVQGDEAVIDPDHIDQLVEHLQNHPDDVMATIATPIKTLEDWNDKNVVKVVLSSDDYALYFSRSGIPHGAGARLEGRGVSKDSNDPWTYPLRHVGIYAFRYDFLEKYSSLPTSTTQSLEDLEQLKVLSAGYRIKVIVVLKAGPDVNVPEDITAVEEWLAKHSRAE